MNKSEHWEKIYHTKSASEVGWYTPHLETSVKWIAELELTPDDPIIDIGAGTSTLVDDLLSLGHRNLTVLDLSQAAIKVTQERLAKKANAVNWLVGDAMNIKLPSRYFSLWHDRAVFHFLIEPDMQQKYCGAMRKVLKLGGYFMVATFEPDAPAQCSGLPVQRYTPESLAKVFGNEFKLERHQNEMHTTPSGLDQAYVYCLFQRIA